MYEYGYPPQILKLGQMVIWYVCFVTIISLDDLMTSCRVFVLCEVDDWRMIGELCISGTFCLSCLQLHAIPVCPSAQLLTYV